MTKDIDFLDYYMILEVSPRADTVEIVERYRSLAMLYHPDNPDTGDRHRFDLIVEAHSVLKDRIKRQEYDSRYEQHFGTPVNSDEETRDNQLIGHDVDIQNKLLSTFYAQRRQNVRQSGLSEFQLESAFGCPVEQLEFHLWYLRAKGWIERIDNGMLAITVEGVDHVNSEYHRRTTTRLLMDRSSRDEETR